MVPREHKFWQGRCLDENSWMRSVRKRKFVIWFTSVESVTFRSKSGWLSLCHDSCHPNDGNSIGLVKSIRDLADRRTWTHLSLLWLV
jgi:hypothetical protein